MAGLSQGGAHYPHPQGALPDFQTLRRPCILRNLKCTLRLKSITFQSIIECVIENNSKAEKTKRQQTHSDHFLKIIIQNIASVRHPK